MKIRLKYLFIFVLISSFVCAQSDFNVDYDYSRLCLDENSGYIEIAYGMRPMEMQMSSVNGDTSVTGIISIRIQEKLSKKIVVNRTWEFNKKVSNRMDSESKQDLVGLSRFVLPKGSYTCDISGQDGNDSTRQFLNSFEFDTKTLHQDRFTLSDLQLATSIVKSDNSESPFYKNHYEVIPNPSLIFGSELPVIFIYCELYRLNIGVQSETIRLDYALLDGDKNEVVKKTKFIPNSVPSMVFVKPITIRNVPSGRHKMIFTVSDTVRKISEKVEKTLYIYNPHIADTSDTGVNAIVVASEYFSMSESEVNDMFAKSRYIASNAEIRGWESLSNYHDKQVFLYHFWKARDMTPDTPINEFKEEYLRRTMVASELYGSMNREGWATDRGRVYCLYGEPNDIEHFPSDIEQIPYEIWHYDEIEGRVIFVFADLHGYGDMYIIHSTKQGELYDPNWRRKVETF